MSVYFISRHITGKLYITLAALWWGISREYRTVGNIILKYKSNRAFLLKNEPLFKRFSLLTKFFFN